ncbi:MAG TPA: EamA family transporter [Anaerolineales bacterium]|nr:EamA family transporter [Anaerolineales bacterium]
MRTKIWLALVTLYIIWGSTYLAIRFAVETIPPFLMAGARCLISGAVLYGWRMAVHDPKPTRAQWRSAIVVGLFLLLGGNGLVSWAEQHVASGIAALVVASIPLWMVLVDALRRTGTRPDWTITLGLLIGFGGIAVLVSSSTSLSSRDGLDPAGLAALLLAALLWSYGSLHARDADMPQSSILGTGIEMLGGAAGLFVVGTLAGEWPQVHLESISLGSVLALVYLIVFGSLVAFVAYSWLLRNAPISLVSTYAYVNPVVAIFLGVWLGSEVITPRILISALVIIGSVVIINLSRQTRVHSPKQPAMEPVE